MGVLTNEKGQIVDKDEIKITSNDLKKIEFLLNSILKSQEETNKLLKLILS